MGEHEKAILEETEAFNAERRRIATQVNNDMPGRCIDARLKEAMRRLRGRHNPLLVRADLEA